MGKRVILYVPGLNDQRFPQRSLLRYLPRIWKQFGFDLIVFPIHWAEGSFLPKLRKLVFHIDRLKKEGYDIYLMGQSAGGSAVLNAFSQRKKSIRKVVNVCGRLRKGKHVFPTLEQAAGKNRAFQESVLLFERLNEGKLMNVDKKKVLTLRPILDEVVPASTVPLQGATNLVLPVIEHSISGIAALTIFSHAIRAFLNE
jgi:hypothetical protein